MLFVYQFLWLLAKYIGKSGPTLDLPGLGGRRRFFASTSVLHQKTIKCHRLSVVCSDQCVALLFVVLLLMLVLYSLQKLRQFPVHVRLVKHCVFIPAHAFEPYHISCITEWICHFLYFLNDTVQYRGQASRRLRVHSRGIMQLCYSLEAIRSSPPCERYR